MAKLDQDTLNQIVAAVVASLQGQGQAASAKADQPQAKAWTNRFGRFDPVAKDRHLLNSFSRKGFKDVVLMDRSDKSKPFNVKPYKAWVAEGRVVRRGEKSVRGLFHISRLM